MRKVERALRDQIQELEKIIALKDRRIAELERATFVPFVSVPTVISIPCQHEYPNPWYATVPPSCKKCGQQAPSYQVTCGGQTIIQSTNHLRVV